MSLIKVREYLKQYEKDEEIVEFDESSATVGAVVKSINYSYISKFHSIVISRVLLSLL